MAPNFRTGPRPPRDKTKNPRKVTGGGRRGRHRGAPRETDRAPGSVPQPLHNAHDVSTHAQADNTVTVSRARSCDPLNR